MMLGRTQQRTLDYLKQYGCLRKDQLEKILLSEFDFVDLISVQRQLNYYNLITNNNDLIILQGRQPRCDVILAIDVMLSFPLPEIQMHKPAPQPFLLTFFKNSKEGKLFRYDICQCKRGNERILSAQLEGLNEKYRTLLIILENITQQKEFQIKQDHCFVIPENEIIKFYKLTEV